MDDHWRRSPSHHKNARYCAPLVQLAFDGPMLTAVTSPVVEVGSRDFHWGDVGYRDELCLRITRNTTAASVSDREIALTFDDGAVVKVSLLPEHLAGRSAESAVFRGEGDKLVVFRPGD
jgi:hypothetical protein